MKGDNAVSHAATIRVTGLAQEMAAYDTLPPLLRATLAASHGKWSAVDMMNRVERASWIGMPIESLVRLVTDGERAEIAAFDEQHQQRFGCRLPHAAAGASILRP